MNQITSSKPMVINSKKARRRPLSVRFAEQPHVLQDIDNTKCNSFESMSAFDRSTTTTTTTRSRKQDTWFTQSELDQFKDAARVVARRVALSPTQQNSDFASCSVGKGAEVKLRLLRRFQSQLMREEKMAQLSQSFPATLQKVDFEVLRGLELRSSFDRQRRKIVAGKAVMEAQRRLKDAVISAEERERRIAEVARTVNDVAKRAAAAAGQNDFVEAWVVEPTTLVPVPTTTPLRKRSSMVIVVSDSDEEHELDASSSSSSSINRNVRRRTMPGAEIHVR